MPTMLEHEPNEPLPPNGPAAGAQADKPRPAAPAVEYDPTADLDAVAEDLIAPMPVTDELDAPSDFQYLLGYFRARRMGRFHP
jgi:hypothetical protein